MSLYVSSGPWPELSMAEHVHVPRRWCKWSNEVCLSASCCRCAVNGAYELREAAKLLWWHAALLDSNGAVRCKCMLSK